MTDIDVRLERVTKTFGDMVAVDDLSLDIAEGEFFSMLGPSGCGKTTTLRMAHGWSIALAAQISPVILFGVGVGGFIVRLGVIVAVIALLQQTDWFSIAAFIATLVPCTVALLVVEMKMLAGRMQADLWSVPGGQRGAQR